MVPTFEDAELLAMIGLLESTVTSLESRKGLLEIGAMTGPAFVGLVAPEPILFRKGLLEARGEATRSDGMSVSQGERSGSMQRVRKRWTAAGGYVTLLRRHREQ